jgi:hypothetical protein
VDGEDSRSSGLVQVSDGLHAEVVLWCASGLIARRWIVPTCVWRLSDCKNVSSCWKITTRSPVGRIILELVFRNSLLEKSALLLWVQYGKSVTPSLSEITVLCGVV